MALLLNISQTEVGASFNSAYARVSHVHVENNFDEPPIISALVEFYASEEARLNRALPVHCITINMAMPQGDFMTGVYTALKTIEGFEGAEDC